MSDEFVQSYVSCYIILRHDNKVAFVLRSNTGWMDGHYGVAPSGRVEKGEPVLQAAIREAKEEVGITVRPEDLQHRTTCFSYNAESGIVWTNICFEATRWEGEVVNAEPHVHGSLDWFDVDDLPENVVPSHRFIVENALAGNSYCEYGWDIEETDQKL